MSITWDTPVGQSPRLDMVRFAAIVTLGPRYAAPVVQPVALEAVEDAYPQDTALDFMADALLAHVIEAKTIDRDWARRTVMEVVGIWQRRQGR